MYLEINYKNFESNIYDIPNHEEFLLTKFRELPPSRRFLEVFKMALMLEQKGLGTPITRALCEAASRHYQMMQPYLKEGDTAVVSPLILAELGLVQ